MTDQGVPLEEATSQEARQVEATQKKVYVHYLIETDEDMEAFFAMLEPWLKLTIDALMPLGVKQGRELGYQQGLLDMIKLATLLANRTDFDIPSMERRGMLQLVIDLINYGSMLGTHGDKLFEHLQQRLQESKETKPETPPPTY